MTTENFSRWRPASASDEGRLRAPQGRNLGGLLLVAVLLLTACGADPAGPKSDQPGVASQSQAMTAEEQERREAMAAARYAETQKLPPNEKVTALSDLAQVYHDTEIAPQAYMDLVFYLSDHSVDQPEAALKALEDFERRRPMAPQVLAAANVMHSVATTKLAAAQSDDERELMTQLRDDALNIYAATAERLVGQEVVADDVGSYYEIGNALILSGRYEEAEQALARIEDFKKPAEDSRRVAFMIRRADLLRGPLKRNQEALELFLQARELQKGLGRASSREQAQYVEEAIKALRS